MKKNNKNPKNFIIQQYVFQQYKFLNPYNNKITVWSPGWFSNAPTFASPSPIAAFSLLKAVFPHVTLY